MKKTVVIVVVVLASLLCFGLSAVAYAGGQAREPSSAVQQRQEQRQEVQQQAAQNLQQRIDLVITRFNNNKDRHIAAYNRAKAEVEQIVTTLGAKGYDVSKLKTDLVTWDQMVVKAAGDYAAFISKLEATKAFTPGQAGGQFAAALADSRAALVLARQDFLDVRTFYQTTIRPDVAALATQQPAGSPSSATTTP